MQRERYALCVTNQRLGDLLAGRAKVQAEEPVGEYDVLQDAFMDGGKLKRSASFVKVFDNRNQRWIDIPDRYARESVGGV
jgi:hypothetical protein